MLDPNLVTAAWGVAALYGVLVSILIIRTDQIYQSYLEKGGEIWYDRARTWALTTRVIPLIAFITVVALSIVAIGRRNGVPIKWPFDADLWNILIGVITMAVFTGIVFMLVSFPLPFQLPLIKCEDASGLSSVDTSRTLTKVTLINNSPTVLQYIWIDRQGNKREKDFCRELANDGQPKMLETWSGHLWVVQDKEGKCICLIRAREQPGGVIIT